MGVLVSGSDPGVSFAPGRERFWSKMNLDDFNEIQVTSQGILVNRKEGEPLKPIDHVIYPNRHERRKAHALKRREARAIGAEWFF